MATFTTSKGETVVSNLSMSEAARLILQAEAAGNPRARVGSFPVQLAERVVYGRKLSPAQVPYLHKFALEINAPPTPRPVVTPARSLLPLVSMLQNASKTLKYPKVLVAVGGMTLQLSIAGPRAMKPGTINVTNGGRYPSNEFYGRILLSGEFEPGRNAGAVLPLLERWAANPVEVVREHGHKTGSCAFCRKSLTTRESTAVGYGPVCAEKFGLPWGGAAATAAERAEEEVALAASAAQEAA